MPASPLGEFEQLVLLAILQLGPDAYGVGLGRKVEAETGRAVSRGALYTTLDRLEDKGLVRWKIAVGGAERGRLPRRTYALTAKGLIAIRAATAALERMTRGLGHILKTPSS
jgi:DNA-binding PadR family transcriptional regulator